MPLSVPKPGMPNIPYDQFLEIPHPVMPTGENNTTNVRILLMLNMVTPENPVDDQEYGDSSTKMSKKSVLDTVPSRIFVSPWPVKKVKTNLPLET